MRDIVRIPLFPILFEQQNLTSFNFKIYVNLIYTNSPPLGISNLTYHFTLELWKEEDFNATIKRLEYLRLQVFYLAVASKPISLKRV